MLLLVVQIFSWSIVRHHSYQQIQFFPRLIIYAQFVTLRARDKKFKLIKKQLILVSIFACIADTVAAEAIMSS